MPNHKSQHRILIIDDDDIFAKSIRDYLRDDQSEVMTAANGADGIEKCRTDRMDVVLLDQKLPDGKGANFCHRIIDAYDRTKIIFITAFPSFENALEAIENGAFTYLSKPIDPREVKIAIDKCLQITQLEKAQESYIYKENLENEQTVWVGESAFNREVEELIRVAATADAHVLITGESGTGKSLVARLIHNRSGREGPFLSINCAALPESLIEAELFGFEKGAFSGAVAAKKGLLEIAEKGTVLLDEIGEMALHLQAKLLGVLEDKSLRRLGSTVSRPVQTRVIAATNSLIDEKVKAGTFREDLFYRLNVIRIHLPPLRERGKDIPALVAHFLRLFSPTTPIVLSPEELTALTSYSWPGNVRELKNVIERGVILQPPGMARFSQYLETLTPQPHPSALSAAADFPTLEEMEKSHIRVALGNYSKNRSRTASALGISLSTLKRKIKIFKLD